MAVNIEVDEPEIDIRVRTYDGYVEVTGISVPLSVGDARVAKGDLVDAGPATSALMVGDAQTSKGDAVGADGTSTALVTGDATTQKGDGVAAGGTDVQVAVGGAETGEGESTQADGVRAPLAVGDVEMEGPWEAPWRPEDRSLSSLDAAFTPYPSAPHFYLRFDEPHDVPKRIKDGWQRGTEATYWDGTQLRTAAPHEPRVQVDPETGERYLLAEPQRTNLVAGEASTYDTNTWNTFNSPTFGTLYTKAGIDFMPCGSGPNGTSRVLNYSNTNTAGAKYWVSFYIDVAETTSGYVRHQHYDGSTNHSETFTPTRSALKNNPKATQLTQDVFYYEFYNVSNDTGGYWHFIPSDNDVSGVTLSLGNVQREKAPFPTSYIPSTSFGTTRAPDDLSDLPFGMESGAKSVYFRLSQEANGYAPNEGGNVTNAEANLTDTPGTAGGGMLRPSTGILGISASGWIDAVVNSTDEDLQGNSTSDVVDGLTIQPDKDPSTDGAIYRIHELVAWEEERNYDERRSLTSQRPQPWQELDPPAISTLDTLDGGIDWAADVGIDSPPHFLVDVPRFGVPAKMRSAWQRDTEATYWNANGVLQTAAPGEPRVARTYDGSQWKTQGVLAEPQRTNQYDRSPRGDDWRYIRNGASLNKGLTGIDGKSEATEIYDSDGGGDANVDTRPNCPAESIGVTWSLFVKKGQGNPFDFGAESPSDKVYVSNLDPKTDIAGEYKSNAGIVKIESWGDWWRLIGTVNNDGSGGNAIISLDKISGGAGSGIIVDGVQLEYHHTVATDANGNADATHATMPILTGGATRSEDKLVMPIWWEQGIVSGGYIEAEKYSGEITIGGEGAHWFKAYLNISDAIGRNLALWGYRDGLFNSLDDSAFVSGGERNDGVAVAAANTNDSTEADMNRLYVLPNRKTGEPDDARFILRRLYLWPQELTEGDDGQLKALFDHDFSL